MQTVSQPIAFIPPIFFDMQAQNTKRRFPIASPYFPVRLEDFPVSPKLEALILKLYYLLICYCTFLFSVIRYNVIRETLIHSARTDDGRIPILTTALIRRNTLCVLQEKVT